MFSDYPHCKQFKVEVTTAHGVSIVTPESLERVFPAGSPGEKQFSAYFGTQTALPEGLYAWDVEAVLKRMATGKRTGTQLIFD